ncbi:uncharacterized protein DUF2188 [Metamycoplasma subdolum]|uniref:Uncharacterized protein DUF2188 n=1 Tax=Metamycoplasma subdolum TaxID=92407 RepID=A0A3M0A2I0_9BACT|nr:DUF2188 domain-containing protein [Metamycoplasma subdolum]RMA78654.1 uncharacterized protein DUF2188 [Metamycoplasma subdolum]WPB50744.1 DUF2188 domain-containing protein [Metamycoplasma subdolum]
MAIRYVVNHEKGWAVTNANAKKVIKTFKTQLEAIKYANSLADTSSVMVQSTKGSFRKA